MNRDIRCVGVNDHDIDLFEGQYRVPHGISYNAYLVEGEKLALLDTVDRRKGEDYLANVAAALDGRQPDYLIVSHVEPDHASSLRMLLERYPETTLVGNAKTFTMLSCYFDLTGVKTLTVKEGDTLSLGAHELTFVMAPMVHWPEVMMTYDAASRTLFSADAFGKFGALDADEEWDDEARRYYFNIVGKYGAQVQAVLKKAAALDIETVCPLHGPVLEGEALRHAMARYATWSGYGVESEGVYVAYASLHGNTAQVARELAGLLEARGVKAVAADLARCELSEAVADAFRYGKVVLAASSYDAGVMPVMGDFLAHLRSKNYQKRTVALVENGSWAPSAARTMKDQLTAMKEVSLLEPVVTIRGAVKDGDRAALAALADQLAK